jgi:uncharacterized Zn finger protein
MKGNDVTAKKKMVNREGIGTGGRKSMLEKIREHLRHLGSDDLVDIVMNEAEDNKDFRGRLLERVTAAGMEWDFADLRKAIRELLRFNGFIEYRQSNRYGMQIDQVAMLLKSIMSHGRASEALDIIESIIPKLEKAISSADDSNGSIGGAIARIAELRLEACREADVDSVKLADRLFSYDIESPWKCFGNFDGKYDAVLGEAGKARYAELVRAEWEKLPDLRVGDSDYSSRRFALRTAMERTAREAGDLELRLAVAGKDLSNPDGYLKMAEMLRDAGRDDEALAWAEKGRLDFANSRGAGYFAAFLADAYHRRGRDDDAIGVYWKMFIDHPSRTDFEQIRKWAEFAGTWPQWREKAMEHLRGRIVAAGGNAPSNAALRVRRNGILVEILISEKRYDEAWNQAALHGCPDAQIRELVEIREKERPADCIPACKLLCEQALVPADSGAYSVAADELAHLGDVMARANMKEDFVAYMQGVRTKYKARKNLVRELDRCGLP